MEEHLRRAVELSRSFEADPRLTPFGAVVVRDGVVLGEGVSSVAAKNDPTAHAEIEAIRAACSTLGDHLLTGAVVYCSGYPCPLCLLACYWAQVGEVWYAADLAESRAVGFEDELFYEQLRLDPAARSIPVRRCGPGLAQEAARALTDWHRTVVLPAAQ